MTLEIITYMFYLFFLYTTFINQAFKKMKEKESILFESRFATCSRDHSALINKAKSSTKSSLGNKVSLCQLVDSPPPLRDMVPKLDVKLLTEFLPHFLSLTRYLHATLEYIIIRGFQCRILQNFRFSIFLG